MKSRSVPPRGGPVDTEELRDVVAQLRTGLVTQIIYFLDEVTYVLIRPKDIAALERFLDHKGGKLSLPFGTIPDEAVRR